MAGDLGEQGQQALAALVADRFNCQIANAVFDEQGQPHGCSLWTRRKDQQKSTTRVFHGPAAELRQDDCPGLLLTDAQLSQWEGQEDGIGLPLLLTTALWNVSTQFESKTLHGLLPAEQVAQWRRLIADGFRPVAISVSGAHQPRQEARSLSAPTGGDEMSEIRTEAPLTTSVWHRRLVPEEAKDRLAKRQANAAVALLRLGRTQKVWSLLAHRPDPRTRSYLIHRFGPLGAAANQVLAQLDAHNDVSIRRALLLSLGELSEQQLPQAERHRVTPRLLDLYANDPDAGIHGAAAWTLRRWGGQAELQKIDQGFARGAPVGERRWFVNRQGQTLVVIPAPGELLIGSPPWEVGREDGPEGDVETQHYVHIDYTFAIMTHQVTVAELLRFRAGFPYRKRYSPHPDCPINNVSWFDAVAYCNWLNELEGIHQDQWCYLPNDQGEYAQGMRLAPDCLRRGGYRLPTEAEWELACRAGSVTSRYYGQSADLDTYYTWNVVNALGRWTTLVGALKPNDWGLFDMMGNTMEWCHDAFRDPARHFDDPSNGPSASPGTVSEKQLRCQRSASLVSWSENTRSAYCYNNYPNTRIFAYGLRVGRTYRPSEEHQSDDLRTDQARVMRGAHLASSADVNRSCYRAGLIPNMRTHGFGMRPVRTMNG
jgi:formylglycine-generating enzyme required for sulfatase activity